MDEKTFRDFAQKYWWMGLSALPVKPGTKQPAVPKWTSFQSSLPGGVRRRNWLIQYADHGIGINTGTKIQLDEILIAIDVDDDDLVKVVSQVLGNPSCAKRGQKGMTFFCRAPKLDKIKSKTLKGGGALGNIDILAGGRFTVLPPTIHPETGTPYTWETQTLLGVDRHAKLTRVLG